MLRLENTPLLAEQPGYAGDTIKAKPLDDGTYVFVRIVERAPVRHCWRVIPPGFDGSPWHEALRGWRLV